MLCVSFCTERVEHILVSHNTVPRLIGGYPAGPSRTLMKKELSTKRDVDLRRRRLFIDPVLINLALLSPYLSSLDMSTVRHVVGPSDSVCCRKAR